MTQEAQENWEKRWSQVVARAWTDGSFKKRLFANPKDALREFGIEVPASVQVKVTEDTATVINLTLPAIPTGELSVPELEKVSGGVQFVGTFSGARLYAAPWINSLNFLPPPPS
jgi:Nitrile hydratase, alpha chain